MTTANHSFKLPRPGAPSPLRAVGLATLVAGACLLILPLPVALRAMLGLPLLLVAPGWTLTAALFAARAIDPVMRALLTIALSIAILIVAGVLMYAAGVRLGAGSFTAVAVGVTVVAALVAERRNALAEIRLPTRPWPATALLIGAVALTALAVVFARRTPTSDAIAPYSALWAASESRGSYRVGVRSEEARRTTYKLDVIAADRSIRHFRLVLRPGEQWQTRLVGAGGGRPIRLELRRPPSATLYRQVDVPR